MTKKLVKSGIFFLDFQKNSPAASYILIIVVYISEMSRKNVDFLLHFYIERKNERFWARSQLKRKNY